MTSPLLTKSFDAGAATEAYRFVKLTAEATVQHAAANTDTIIGTTTEVGAKSGARQDVHMAGVVEVEYGGNVSRGEYLTSDANGKAVAAGPAAGANNAVGGIALSAGVDGDIGAVLLVQTQIQG